MLIKEPIKEYYNQICGYIKISALSDEDSIDIIEQFFKSNLEPSGISSENMYQWLHYKVDLFLFTYYNQYKKTRDDVYKNKIKMKVRFLFDRLNHGYPEFSPKDDLREISMNDNTPSFHLLQKYFRALGEAGYPNQVLVFCSHLLLENNNIQKIVAFFSRKTLDLIYDDFVNTYSDQSGLPAYLVNIYFLSMKEKLNKKLKFVLSKNDSVTLSKLEEYLNWTTGWTMLDFYYGKNKEANISDWCNKVKVKAVKNMATILDKIHTA